MKIRTIFVCLAFLLGLFLASCSSTYKTSRYKKKSTGCPAYGHVDVKKVDIHG